MSELALPFAGYEEHSLVLAARSLQPAIRECAGEIEASGTIPPHLIEALTERGLFRLNIPRAATASRRIRWSCSM